MNNDGWPTGTETLLDEILTDAYGDDEQLWALRQAFEDNVELPADASRPLFASGRASPCSRGARC